MKCTLIYSEEFLPIYKYVVHVKTVESANVVNVVEDDAITVLILPVNSRLRHLQTW